MSASATMKEIRRKLEKEGFVLEKTRGGHWKIAHPQMDGPVFAPDTPSDHRAIKNLLATIRRKIPADNDMLSAI